MTAFDLLCISIAVPLFLYGCKNLVWWIRFRRHARINKYGTVIYKIEERNVK